MHANVRDTAPRKLKWLDSFCQATLCASSSFSKSKPVMVSTSWSSVFNFGSVAEKWELRTTILTYFNCTMLYITISYNFAAPNLPRTCKLQPTSSTAVLPSSGKCCRNQALPLIFGKQPGAFSANKSGDASGDSTWCHLAPLNPWAFMMPLGRFHGMGLFPANVGKSRTWPTVAAINQQFARPGFCILCSSVCQHLQANSHGTLFLSRESRGICHMRVHHTLQLDPKV